MKNIPEFTWSFIEEYYPNYTSSPEIALSDDLNKIICNEWEKGDASHTLIREIGLELNTNLLSAIRLEASKRSRSYDLKIYHKAIQNYLES
tara:strand:- start:2363 stop:2635 length:273 start_codon:yes stop_codon:yes gene_type:complete